MVRTGCCVLLGLAWTLHGCDPAKDPESEQSSSSSEASGTSEAPPDDALPPACLDWIGGEGGANAEEACRQALDVECAANDEQTCEAIVLGPTGNDNPLICVWAETWRGSEEAMCEAGTYGTACLGAENPGDIGSPGPAHRGVADDTWIAVHDEPAHLVGYRGCELGRAVPPAACECLAR